MLFFPIPTLSCLWLATMTMMMMSSLADANFTKASYFYRRDRPLVIAHRGSAGHFPEHSLGSYSDAFFGGADFIEVDLQVTKDGHLVAHHDAELN